MILMMMALFMILITAMLSMTNTELKSSDHYESGVRTEQLSEICKSVVVSQIRKSTEFNADKGFSWASQPGAIRRYSPNGEFFSGHKLYSDAQMDIVGEDQEPVLATDTPPKDWNGKPLHYVDLNSPVVRTGKDGNLHTYFPIFDPRAAHNDPDTEIQRESVQGFSFGGDLVGIVKDGDLDEWRVPMPVEWLYVLADGTLGVLNEENKFEPADKVSKENPIQGRIAFWTDDECCKININTASEPTYWATPTIGDRADWGWAKIQPGAGEYQRFPGHPATTALSPVLYPNQIFADPPYPDWGGKMDPQNLKLARESSKEKGKIYDWAPKIQDIGSISGTEFVQFSAKHSKNWKGPKKNYHYAKEYDADLAIRERLYASVDEFLLRPDRSENDFVLTNYRWNSATKRRNRAVEDSAWVNEDVIRRSRAFLTAHSRAPETTLFGTPRIAVWPIHRNATAGAGYLTHFDRLIARCATLGEVEKNSAGNDNSYYFRRERNDSSTHDIGLPRNKKLLKYLQRLTGKPFPGYGDSFLNKYGDDRDQILVEMFDYIRSTNLYDPYLAGEGNDDNGDYKTYSAGRRMVKHKGKWVVDYRDGGGNFRNGHGHVVPSRPDDMDARGLGRVMTINEVAMHFICCADGSPNEYTKFKNRPGPWTGGAAAEHNSSVDDENDPTGFVRDVVTTIPHSNFPPDVIYQTTVDEDADPADRNPYGNNKKHPGYNREHWNYSLDSKKPLNRGKKRIQGMLIIDFFSPAPGYNPLVNRYGVRLKGLKNLKVDGKTIYPKDEATDWRAFATPDAHTSPGAGFMNKTVDLRPPYSQEVDRLPKDGTKVNRLVTNFIDVDELSMDFGAVGPVTIEIIVQPGGGEPIEVLQTFQIRFPDPVRVPSPNLVLQGDLADLSKPDPDDGDPEEPDWWDEDLFGPWKRAEGIGTQASYYWSYYKKGYNRASNGRMNGAGEGISWKKKHGTTIQPVEGNYIFPDKEVDVVFSMLPWHGDYRLLAAKEEVGHDPQSPYVMGGSGRVFIPSPGAPYFESANNRAFGWHSFDHKFKGTMCALGHGIFWKDNEGDLANKYTPNDLAGLSWWRPNIKISGKAPHFPNFLKATKLSRRYGDFDIGPGKVQGGSFINKPDAGSLNGVQNGRNNMGVTVNEKQMAKVPYFSHFGNSQEIQDGFFSPNRMIPSPAMMGSLPSGVKANDPWRTLLFRPDVNSVDENGQETTHPGAETPPDHLLLDLFWMPVVEPYAISEPFSTAGKINLNYQILPFRHIRRKTAMFGLLKDQRITSLPVAEDPSKDKTFAVLVSRDASAGAVTQRRYIHRPIHVPDTLKAFDQKFNREKTLFRSASQICEMHLIPGVGNIPNNVNFHQGAFSNREADPDVRMKAFWKTYRGTSDNLRERPYANIYSRVTTQTNTWRIHYRVQGIKKSRDTAADTFDPQMDSISSESRGSTLLERYIDPSDPALPDFTEKADANLDAFYRFRVLSKRKFSM